MRQITKICFQFLLILFLLATSNLLPAQDIDNIFQSRMEFKLGLNPIKKLKLNFTPELRLNDKLQFDKLLMELDAKYKVIKHIEIGGSYGLVGNKKNNGDLEYYGRFAIFTEADYKLNRFTPSLRLSYTNSADDDTNSQYLRYKLSIDYDIRKTSLTPEIGFEAFQYITQSNMYKLRYSVGAKYKLFKNNYIGISYKLDFYLQEYKNRHIVSVGYKYKF